MAPPSVLRRQGRVVIGIVVQGFLNLRTVNLHRGQIATVFLVQRATVIFEVVEDVERAVRRVFDQRRSNF